MDRYWTLRTSESKNPKKHGHFPRDTRAILCPVPEKACIPGRSLVSVLCEPISVAHYELKEIRPPAELQCIIQTRAADIIIGYSGNLRQHLAPLRNVEEIWSHINQSTSQTTPSNISTSVVNKNASIIIAGDNFLVDEFVLSANGGVPEIQDDSEEVFFSQFQEPDTSDTYWTAQNIKTLSSYSIDPSENDTTSSKLEPQGSGLRHVNSGPLKGEDPTLHSAPLCVKSGNVLKTKFKDGKNEEMSEPPSQLPCPKYTLIRRRSGGSKILGKILHKESDEHIPINLRKVHGNATLSKCTPKIDLLEYDTAEEWMPRLRTENIVDESYLQSGENEESFVHSLQPSTEFHNQTKRTKLLPAEEKKCCQEYLTCIENGKERLYITHDDEKTNNATDFNECPCLTLPSKPTCKLRCGQLNDINEESVLFLQNSASDSEAVIGPRHSNVKNMHATPADDGSRLLPVIVQSQSSEYGSDIVDDATPPVQVLVVQRESMRASRGQDGSENTRTATKQRKSSILSMCGIQADDEELQTILDVPTEFTTAELYCLRGKKKSLSNDRDVFTLSSKPSCGEQGIRRSSILRNPDDTNTGTRLSWAGPIKEDFGEISNDKSPNHRSSRPSLTINERRSNFATNTRLAESSVSSDDNQLSLSLITNDTITDISRAMSLTGYRHHTSSEAYECLNRAIDSGNSLTEAIPRTSQNKEPIHRLTSKGSFDVTAPVIISRKPQEGNCRITPALHRCVCGRKDNVMPYRRTVSPDPSGFVSLMRGIALKRINKKSERFTCSVPGTSSFFEPSFRR
ncbi:unnamed protein product [Calicophoron daubneyi]|uniref:Uncharacterized protein n=1 Tax=Calicophoron daubneyi TaxID=300641 RepID=A0AAV2T4R4_CALDB